MPTLSNKSILILAHPDDEILWFSSIIDKVDRILLCFCTCDSNKIWTAGRKNVLRDYPLDNISCLDLHESGAFNMADWKNPVETKYGIKISATQISERRYQNNYFALIKLLKKEIDGFHNIFTHNPWGEYGNEEHVQIYRVVKKLQLEMDFNLWFSNYCSNKSLHFFLNHYHPKMIHPRHITHTTNNNLSHKIIDLYKKHGCWTWYGNWQLFDQETFIEDNVIDVSPVHYGRCFPINFINVEPQPQIKTTISFSKANILYKLKRLSALLKR